MHIRTLFATALFQLPFPLVASQGSDAEMAKLYRNNPFGYAQRQFPVNKYDEPIARHFPEVDGFELLSPAFTDPNNVSPGFANGTAAPTSQEVQESFLRALAVRNDWMTYADAGFTSEEGRPFSYLYMTSTKTNQTNNKIRLLIQSSIHGNEPGSEEGVLAFLGKMDDNATWAESVLEKMDIIVIPRANPDGAAYFQRELARGLDPNRDFAAMRSQQTRNLADLYVRLNPHIFLDIHESGAFFPLGPNGTLIRSTDVEATAMSPPNVHKSIQLMENQLFIQDMYAALRREKLRTGTYVAGGKNNASRELSEPEPSGSSGLLQTGLRQTVSLLIESRGVGIGDQHFQRRVVGVLVAITQLVHTTYDNAEHIYRTIVDAREDFVNSDKEITITARGKMQSMTWPFIDANNGSLINENVRFMNFTLAESNLTRSRPAAYVFSSAWYDVAERMRIAGVNVGELQYDYIGEVEALKVNTSMPAGEISQGIFRNTVTTSNYSKEITIPAGGYWISTRQVAGAVAFGFLEPENVASAVSLNIVPLVAGEESPIYRVLKQ